MGNRIITLLTDFGTRDTFVGVMKGVIKGIAADADVIDLTHEIAAQDIAGAAFALKTAYHYFPPGTIHLVVVDPGVGSTRRPMAAHIGDYRYVCPDNGILSYILAEDPVHAAAALTKPQYHRPQVSRTFHGRDVFAPVAAHLAAGVPLASLGTALHTWTTFPLPRPLMVSPDRMLCHVIGSDHFGNVFLDLTEDVYDTWAAPAVTLHVSGRDIRGLSESYSDVPVSTPLALFGSSGHLEIAVRDGSAREILGLHIGDHVTVARRTL